MDYEQVQRKERQVSDGVAPKAEIPIDLYDDLRRDQRALVELQAKFNEYVESRIGQERQIYENKVSSLEWEVSQLKDSTKKTHREQAAEILKILRDGLAQRSDRRGHWGWPDYLQELKSEFGEFFDKMDEAKIALQRHPVAGWIVLSIAMLIVGFIVGKHA